MKKMLVVAIAAAVLVLFTSCYAEYSGGGDPAGKFKNVGTTEIVLPVDYGNGVYYFPAVRAVFGNSLSAFKKNHPELSFISMAADDYQSGGYTTGYFVVFESNR